MILLEYSRPWQKAGHLQAIADPLRPYNSGGSERYKQFSFSWLYINRDKDG